MQHKEKNNHSAVLSNLKDLLYKETALFKLILARFQKKLPLDKFMQACQGVKRNLRILENKELPLPNFGQDSSNKLQLDINKWIEYGGTAATIANSSLVALGWCQQKLRIGHITQSHSLGLGILSSIYSLCKTLTHELSQICLLATVKKADSKQKSLKDCQALLERRLQVTISSLEMENGNSDEEESLAREDLGEVVSRENAKPEKKQKPDKNESLVQNNLPVCTKKNFLKELHCAKSVKELRTIYQRLRLQMKQVIAEETKQDEIIFIFRAAKSACNELTRRKMSVLSQAAEQIAEIVFSKTEMKKTTAPLQNMERKDLKRQLLACGNLLQLQKTCKSIFPSKSPISKKVDKLIQRGLNTDESNGTKDGFRRTIAKILRTVYPVQGSRA